MGGVDVKAPRRREAIESAAAGFGVQTDGRNLFVEARAANVGARAHALIQAMISVNDLYVWPVSELHPCSLKTLASGWMRTTFGIRSR